MNGLDTKAMPRHDRTRCHGIATAQTKFMPRQCLERCEGLKTLPLRGLHGKTLDFFALHGLETGTLKAAGHARTNAVVNQVRGVHINKGDSHD